MCILNKSFLLIRMKYFQCSLTYQRTSFHYSTIGTNANVRRFQIRQPVVSLCQIMMTGMTRIDAEEKFKNFHYIIYNSASNTSEQNRFRIILFLKEPVSALQLKLIRKTSKFKSYFEGVDFGTFAIGRFFKIPSKYDKDEKPVEVIEQVGDAFDFYSLFPKVAYSAAFEALKQQMFRKQMDKNSYKQPQTQKYREWISKTFPNGVHYMDLCACATRAKSLNITYADAVSLFERNYIGHSDWKKNYQNFWKKI